MTESILEFELKRRIKISHRKESVGKVHCYVSKKGMNMSEQRQAFFASDYSV